MGTRPPKLSAVLIAVAFALSVFGFTLFVWLSFGGTIPLKPQGYRFNAFFGAEAAQLTSGAEVRISGIRVGRVVAVNRDSRGANAVIELERRYAPVETDATAIIRQKTLLGETFIELAPGSAEGPEIREGGSLARSRVQPVQAVDEVLGSFDAPTREALKVFLADLSAALDDRGEDLNAALGHAPATLEQLTALAELLDRQEPAVRGLVRNGGIALRAIGRREQHVRTIVREGNSLLSATAARDASLSATIRELPAFLRELRSGLVEVRRTTDVAKPTLDELRPVTPLVRPALEDVTVLAPELEQVFKELGGIIDTSRRALRALDNVIEAAEPLLAAAHQAAPELIPVARLARRYRRQGLDTLAKLAASTQGTIDRGVNPGYVRVIAPLWNEGIVGAGERFGTNRYNPYEQPGALSEFLNDGLEAFNCEHTGNATPLPGMAPGCMVAGPWEFEDESRAFPHPQRYDYADPE